MGLTHLPALALRLLTLIQTQVRRDLAQTGEEFLDCVRDSPIERLLSRIVLYFGMSETFTASRCLNKRDQLSELAHRGLLVCELRTRI